MKSETLFLMKKSRLAQRENSWTESAQIVFKERYLRKDSTGKTRESPADLFRRVAEAVSSVEVGAQRRKYIERFYLEMASGRFLPNSPTLMNAGRPNGQLSACYVLPVKDSLDSIFEALKQSARIHQSGGGTGFSFSELRENGSLVAGTQGVASGPVSFIRTFDTATETVKQGGVRRGANMAVLRVDHPDVFAFIESKRDFKSITNFNISVGITDEFMETVRLGQGFSLRSPQSGRTVCEVSARDLFQKIVDNAWTCGDPGLLFLDRINRFNPTPARGELQATNPCGEQPLLPFESCNLGSINLSKFVWDGVILWEDLAATVDLAVRFLDNVIDVNGYPIEESRRITLANRKIGLGVMGFADMLLELGIPYDSTGARELGECVMSFIDRHAKRASILLARARGSFSGFRQSLWARLGYPAMRNATVSTVAPTGTISILAGCSSGIEPIFSARFERHVLEGQVIREVHPAVLGVFRERGGVGEFSEEKLRELIGAVWAPARELSVEAHLQMQAVFQRHSDSAVSKTINLPQEATLQDVERAFLRAFELGCKGITVYRDQSRPTQVLQAVRDESCEVCAD